MNGIKQIFCVMIAAILVMSAADSFAQATIEWTSPAKIVNGGCGDGVVAQVIQRGSTLNMKGFLNGKQVSEVNVTLGPDGSGKANMTGAGGRVILEVSPGTGKRLMKSSQVDGPCQWTWIPR